VGGGARGELETMMNRWIWIVRIFGILMLLAFFILFAEMQRRYMQMQGRVPASTTTTR
jgi:hypothetical protein